MHIDLRRISRWKYALRKTRPTLFLMAISLIAAASGSSTSGTDDSATCLSSAPIFWAKFREAVSGGSAKEASSLTLFPLALRPILPDGPAHWLNQPEFEQRYAEFMNQDSGEFEDPLSMHELILQTSRPQSLVCGGDSGEFQVGRFILRYSNRKWRLTTIYK